MLISIRLNNHYLQTQKRFFHKCFFKIVAFSLGEFIIANLFVFIDNFTVNGNPAFSAGRLTVTSHYVEPHCDAMLAGLWEIKPENQTWDSCASLCWTCYADSALLHSKLNWKGKGPNYFQETGFLILFEEKASFLQVRIKHLHLVFFFAKESWKFYATKKKDVSWSIEVGI